MKPPKLNTGVITPTEKSNSILETTQKKLSFVPNMSKGVSINTSTLDAYTYTYDSFRKNSRFTPVEQEVVLLSVSYYNDCEYCMAAHSFAGDHITNVPKEVTNAIRNGKDIPDVKLNALSHFTKTMTEKRTWNSEEDLYAFFAAGYSEKHVLGDIMGIAVKTLSNYSNHLTQNDLDNLFQDRKWVKP